MVQRKIQESCKTNFLSKSEESSLVSYKILQLHFEYELIARWTNLNEGEKSVLRIALHGYPGHCLLDLQLGNAFLSCTYERGTKTGNIIYLFSLHLTDKFQLWLSLESCVDPVCCNGYVLKVGPRKPRFRETGSNASLRCKNSFSFFGPFTLSDIFHRATIGRNWRREHYEMPLELLKERWDIHLTKLI